MHSPSKSVSIFPPMAGTVAVSEGQIYPTKWGMEEFKENLQGRTVSKGAPNDTHSTQRTIRSVFANSDTNQLTTVPPAGPKISPLPIEFKGSPLAMLPSMFKNIRPLEELDLNNYQVTKLSLKIPK